MSRRRNHGPEELLSEEEGELNLTPYLDIITTLVIFMVFTFQQVIEFRLIEVFQPALGDSSGSSDTPQEPPIVVTLVITDEGYRLMTDRDELAPSEIPRNPDGSYNNDKLRSTAIMFKEKLPLGESIVFTAGSEIEYSVIVGAMDAIRSNNSKWLFPDVQFGQATVGGG